MHSFFPPLEDYVAARAAEGDAIDTDRRADLDRLAHAMRRLRDADGIPRPMLFVCTHNSRRSHLGQVWAAVAARVHAVDGLATYSAGTEATAFEPRAIAALERAGLRLERPEGENPRVAVRAAPDVTVATCFSKTLTDPELPASGVLAVMTCHSADRACPAVAGAVHRVALTYRDPKEADGLPEEARVYDERCAQIAREMLYLFAAYAAE